MCTGAFCFLYFWQYITKNERNVIHIDAGRVVWQLNISVGYLDQYAEIEKNMTMQSFLKSAFSRLYQLEREMAT